MYNISYAISLVVERIALTFEGLTQAIVSPRYSIGEFIYDTISLWK